MKVKLTLLVDKDTVVKSKEIGINLSKFLEHNLKRAIDVLEESEGIK
jgi:post-segregation antitoxin (ccd killing protein)|tara:strand:- start:299 stop:439 length:141 start_codon:yes stop_codon:yes gene_type:complete